jgi:hypothetical protein
MLQMDGSDHEWVKGQHWTLIAGIDDASSEVPYGEFFPTENLEGYLRVLRFTIEKKGVPLVLYVDHASWLSGTTKSHETGQFKRICEELAITLIFANSPQAKGRIERLWNTYQDRLVAEFAYHRITDRRTANEYLNNEFLPKTWNARFTVAPKRPESCYRAAPTMEGLHEILCLKYQRKVRNDHTILWGNRLYRITASLSYSIAKRSVEIRQYADNQMRGYYAGLDLELSLVNRVEDRVQNHPLSYVPGLTIQVTESTKKVENIK